MELIGKIADVLVVLAYGLMFLCLPFIFVLVQKEEKREEREKEKWEEEKNLYKALLKQCEERNEFYRRDIDEIFEKVEEEREEYYALKKKYEKLKEESDAHWRQLCGFLQRHPEEVETIDEDEINNPDDYQYVAR